MDARIRLRNTKSILFKVVIIFFAFVITIPLIIVLLYIIKQGVMQVNWHFLTNVPAPVGAIRNYTCIVLRSVTYCWVSPYRPGPGPAARALACAPGSNAELTMADASCLDPAEARSATPDAADREAKMLVAGFAVPRRGRA